MDRTERFYKIDALLHANPVVSTARFLKELEISVATLKRDIEYMRDRLNAPIEWDRSDGGYRYVADHTAQQQSLPGLWFNASEAYALLMMQSLLSEMQPGLLGPHIAPLSMLAIFARPVDSAINMRSSTWRSGLATHRSSSGRFTMLVQIHRPLPRLPSDLGAWLMQNTGLPWPPRVGTRMPCSA